MTWHKIRRIEILVAWKCLERFGHIFAWAEISTAPTPLTCSALAMRHRLSGISTYGLNGLGREMSTPPTLHRSMAPLPLPLFTTKVEAAQWKNDRQEDRKTHRQIASDRLMTRQMLFKKCRIQLSVDCHSSYMNGDIWRWHIALHTTPLRIDCWNLQIRMFQLLIILIVAVGVYSQIWL